MTLSEQQISIISENPLNDTLDRFRIKLGDCDQNDQLLWDEIASLVGALQRVRGGGMTLEPFRPLISSVVDNAPDVNIWDAVLSLIDTLSSLTPPPSSIVPTYKGTPVKTSSSRLADSETRDIVEGELFFEIKDCTFRNVGGFCDKFFDSKSWRKEQKEMLNRMMVAHDGKKWTNFPSTPDEDPVWTWLCALEERFLTDAPHKLYTTRTANQFKERKGQMDLFFQKPARKANSTFTYKDVLVVGEQKKSDKFKATLLQLTRYVRGVFADQPTRRFVHAFSLCASKMELWVFDRSGPYSSGSFDIHNEPDKFARALVGYATMDDDEMGLDVFIERKKGHRYVTCADTNGKEVRIELKELLVRQRAVVCRGTCCYRTRKGHVAKLSWASDKRKPEVEHLELAAKRGVKGLARFRDEEDVPLYDIPPSGPKNPEITDLQSSFAIVSVKKLTDKRKSSSENTTRSKRSRSNSQKSRPNSDFEEQRPSDKSILSLYTPNPEDPFENRVYSCLVTSPAGRVISDFGSILELLEALRDAIRAHQSLYTIADGFKGMLIDLDLAKVKDSGPSGARHQTGTMQFMAIEVLRKADHTYRHDLESFFYVLLWMCARFSWTNGFSGEEEPPQESVLRKWEIGGFKDIARTKAYHMSVDGLEEVMDEFPEKFRVLRPLCLRIRKILFPLDKDERMSVGTPTGDPSQLYNSIIVAYDEAIGKQLND
ncbi:hypothetical protein HRG_003332 [Hirsutella rhossiliensis]|uniref:Fungal-type protein kinase domain-containing protein n=1 Tax=Hirsutella rhossiliensis TaxID=111463 RepID=A0A9P8SLM9_9HYPO|nr:uncharacterized protein HRG_03332 [Hirsutella rhossiliensis]KAH0965316.1 hypothetical protein HRG_03332 [Hirsutella rhossiliensis]